MGDVVKLARNRCPCGWYYPPIIQVVVRELIRVGYAVRFTCPECGAEATTCTVQPDAETE